MPTESTVVQSAISSFNNMALMGPDFFWSGILCLPIFAVFWFMASNIVTRFIPDVKKRKDTFIVMIMSIITLWILSHGAYGTLRDQSVAPILVATCLFVCTVFITRRISDLKLNLNKKWVRHTKWFGPTLAIAIAGFTGTPTVPGFILHAGACTIGIFTGLLMNKMNKNHFDSELVIILLTTALGIGIAMQPEIFRFGQMGQLTVIHIAGLIIYFKILATYFAARWVRPAEKISESWYKKMILVMRLMHIMTLLLFVFTESALVLGMLTVTAFMSTALSVRHMPQNTNLQNTISGLWNISLGAFGILVNTPLLVCIAIILWQTSKPNKFIATIKKML